jgi:hypothetical protein
MMMVKWRNVSALWALVRADHLGFGLFAIGSATQHRKFLRQI